MCRRASPRAVFPHGSCGRKRGSSVESRKNRSRLVLNSPAKGPQAMDRIYLSPPEAGPVERELLLDAFDSNWIAPMGPHVDAFEREFADAIGVPYAAALSSGTAALHLALIALGVGKGDVVLTSTLTFAATVNAIAYVGARPVFIDVSADTWTLDPALLDEELSLCQRRGTMPAAVIAVD